MKTIPIEQRSWHRFVRRFSILLAIKTSLIVLMTYYLGVTLSVYLYPASPQIGGLWCVVSGVVVLQVLVQESFSAAWLRIVGSFIGASTSFVFASCLGYTMLTLLLCVFCTVILCALLRIRTTFRLASLTAVIVIVIGFIDVSVPPWLNAILRFLESTVGALVAVGLTALFYPLRKKWHLSNPI